MATAVVVLLVGSTLGTTRRRPVPRSLGRRPGRRSRLRRRAHRSPAEIPQDAPLLRADGHGDGDSWRDTAGHEYRLGLVNAPEQDECFGAEATAERQRQVAAGFRAEVYSVDLYDRSVSLVTTADGVALNVHLARQGFVDDRYLADFRHEHPSLAAESDAAFAEARAHGRGLWSACDGDAVPVVPVTDVPPVRAGCHPEYVTCVPVAGDGSRRGNDLDRGDADGPVQARRPGVDPYRLDADGDGVGCHS